MENIPASELDKLTQVDTFGRPAWSWQQQQHPFRDCTCGSCQRLRREHPEYMLDEIQKSVRDLTAHTKAQDVRIAKLEGLVKMLTEALGVNEAFLSDTFKGVV